MLDLNDRAVLARLRADQTHLPKLLGFCHDADRHRVETSAREALGIELYVVELYGPADDTWGLAYRGNLSALARAEAEGFIRGVNYARQGPVPLDEAAVPGFATRGR